MRLSGIFFCARFFALAISLAGCGGASGTRGALPPNGVTQRPDAYVASTTRGKPSGTNVSSSGFSALRATFTHSLLCDNGVLIAKYAQTYGIQTIFVPVAGDDISSLLDGNPTTVKNLNAMAAVANVYMVSGDVGLLSTPTSVPPDAASLAKIAALYPQFAGILFAVDPEQLPAWNSSERENLIQQYFTLVSTLLSAPGSSAFKQILFTADTDYANIHLNGFSKNPTLLQHLVNTNGVGGVTMIVPGNTASIQLGKITNALAQLSKPFWIEASTSKYAPNSYYGVTPSYLQSNLSQLQQSVSSQNARLLGIEVSGWNDLYNGLQSILTQPPAWNGVLPNGPLVPPAGTTYLGAFVNPTGSGSSSAQTAAFETQIGRKLAYDMHFYGWASKFPGAGEANDVANGRIPLIAWNCGDSDANVAAGRDDALIIARANAIKAFGSPVFLRWFWEMNLDDTNNAPRTQCYDPNADLAQGYFSPTHYIAAWRHIRQIFDQQGVTNVVWLWCVANAHGGPGQYYPGDDVVDWVGMDDYDTYDVPMQKTFFILANELLQFQEKPFMITETGAHAQTQNRFLTGAAAELQSQFPQARAIGYLDAQGSFQNWVLTSTGMNDFRAFAQDSYMSAFAAAP